MPDFSPFIKASCDNRNMRNTRLVDASESANEASRRAPVQEVDGPAVRAAFGAAAQHRAAPSVAQALGAPLSMSMSTLSQNWTGPAWSTATASAAQAWHAVADALSGLSGAGLFAWLGVQMGLGTKKRDYHGQWALVTGASSGIGACFAEALARRGANVILVARREDKLRELAQTLVQKHGVHTEVLPTDLSKPQAAAGLLGQIRELGLPVQVLVNNAGLGSYGRAEGGAPERQAAILQVNVVASSELLMGCLPAMQAAQEGSIFNISSIAAFTPIPHMATYGATKAYLRNFSESLWAENRKNNVRILAVCPGGTATPFFGEASMGKPEAALGRLASCDSVVDSSFKAMDEDRSYIIPSSLDYVKTQGTRLLPRGFMASAVELVLCQAG